VNLFVGVPQKKSETQINEYLQGKLEYDKKINKVLTN
jgi:hypothetical protein